MTKHILSLFCFAGMLMILAETSARCQNPIFLPDPPAAVPAPLPETLTIKIVSGDEGSNFLKRRFAVSPVVEVRDRFNRPVAGATVIFTSPEVGPGVRFVPGRQYTAAVTELDGRAKSSTAIPVRLGKFQMMVTASYSDYAVATAIIHQTNYKNLATAKKSGVSVRMRSSASRREK